MVSEVHSNVPTSLSTPLVTSRQQVLLEPLLYTTQNRSSTASKSVVDFV